MGVQELHDRGEDRVEQGCWDSRVWILQRVRRNVQGGGVGWVVAMRV